jgi:hypothetical protein
VKAFNLNNSLGYKLIRAKNELGTLEREVRDVSDRMSDLMDYIEEIQGEMSKLNKLEEEGEIRESEPVGIDVLRPRAKVKEEALTSAQVWKRIIFYLLSNFLISALLIMIAYYGYKFEIIAVAYVFAILAIDVERLEKLLYAINDVTPDLPYSNRIVVILGHFTLLAIGFKVLANFGEFYVKLQLCFVVIAYIGGWVRFFKRAIKLKK